MDFLFEAGKLVAMRVVAGASEVLGSRENLGLVALPRCLECSRVGQAGART